MLTAVKVNLSIQDHVQFVSVIQDENPSKIKPGLKLEGIIKFYIVSI